MIDYARIRTDLIALGLLALAVFLGLSLASYHPADPPGATVFPAANLPQNLAGLPGAIAAQTLISTFGIGAYFLLAGLVILDIRLLARDNSGDPFWKIIGAGMMLLSLCVVTQWCLPFSIQGSLTGNGGYTGASIGILLDEKLSRMGSAILLGSAFASGLLMSGEHHLLKTSISFVLLPITLWSRLAFGAKPTQPETISPEPTESGESSEADVELASIGHSLETPIGTHIVNRIVPIGSIPIAETSQAITTPRPAEVDYSPLVKSAGNVTPIVESKKAENTAESPPDDSMTFTLAPQRTPIRVNPPSGMKAPSNSVIPLATEPIERQPYQLPGREILEEAEAFPYDILAAKAQTAAATLEQTFTEFGLNVKVVEIDTGPVITQFELELEKGLRLSKVTALAEDLAIALRVPSVRVVAPIPGKNTVGVEVPNDVRVMVRLKELLQTCHADFETKAIPLFLGKDVSGKPMVIDMCKMPHLLIAGRTGTGKSVCLNTLILSILLSRSPDKVKMLMIDPKMVELSPYSRIPHLMHPVITDMKKAEAVLGWAVDKMEERYDLLARVGVRHLDSYNKLGRAKVLKKLGIDDDSDEADLVPETMPYIVIIADEMADMMMTSGKDVEGHIIRLAQKSRAVGIHLVLATQKPTVDVITGLIKSNLPARISFQVASRMDSRVVLDEMGADKLLGNGDLLYMAPGTSSLRRAQGTFVSDDEVNRVIEFFSDQQPEYDQELMQLQVASSKGGKGSSEPRVKDDLYEQAVEVV
ncbi:MAG: DNA translocase FtsK, partial [Planctomycetes bacterium]|nr:DNA translocase FtsK [Planctomycetota bacterium]